MLIYVATSWRNSHQPEVVHLLRDAGHVVYDFRNPSPDDRGFNWREIDLDWPRWTVDQYLAAIKHPLADKGFESDFFAMQAADACVLVLPCGRSAHLEAGYFVGRGKPLFILLLEKIEPELMYKMATEVFTYIDPMIARLAELQVQGQICVVQKKGQT